MATFRSAAELAKHQRSRARKVRRSLDVGSKAVAEEMRKEAIRLTSGTVTTKQLREMGHPYARRRTGTRRRGRQRGTLPRLPIHRQSGRLQKSLRVFRRMSSRGISWQIQFTAPHSPFVLAPGGTENMVARGFWAAMRRFYYSKARRRLIQAWRLAHK